MAARTLDTDMRQCLIDFFADPNGFFRNQNKVFGSAFQAISKGVGVAETNDFAGEPSPARAPAPSPSPSPSPQRSP